MQDGCIVTWHQINHVPWSLGLFSKTHLLEVGLTQSLHIVNVVMRSILIYLRTTILNSQPTHKIHWVAAPNIFYPH